VRLARARALCLMSATGAAFVAGDIGVSTVNQLVAARRAQPEVFERHEAGLVEAVKPLSPRDTYRVVEYWRPALDHYRHDCEQRHEQRRFNVSSTFEGMVRGDFDLDPESGQIVLAAIRALSESRVHRPGRHSHSAATPG